MDVGQNGDSQLLQSHALHPVPSQVASRATKSHLGLYCHSPRSSYIGGVDNIQDRKPRHE